MKRILLALAVLSTCSGNGQTAEEDHRNMMEQLGIKSLRPGPSGDEKAPNHANYDESLANPFPDYPDVPYPVIAKELIGHVDNSAYPAISVDLQMVVVTPA